MPSRLFDEWSSQIRDLAVFAEIAKTLSEGQRLDVLRALFDSSDDDTRRRMQTWISDRYGPLAALRQAVANLGKTKKEPGEQ